MEFGRSKDGLLEMSMSWSLELIFYIRKFASLELSWIRKSELRLYPFSFIGKVGVDDLRRVGSILLRIF